MFSFIVYSCVINFLKIYEGNSTKTEDLKATFCGNLTGRLPIIQSYTNVLRIEYNAGSYGSGERRIRIAVSSKVYYKKL